MITQQKPGTCRVLVASYPDSLNHKDLDGLDGVSLQTLLALDDRESHLLTFFEALEAIGFDRAEVNEDVFAIFTADKTKALGIVEPLDGTGFAV